MTYISFPKFEIKTVDGSILDIAALANGLVDGTMREIVLKELVEIFSTSRPDQSLTHVFGILDMSINNEAYVYSVEKNNEKQIVDRRINGEEFTGDFFEWFSQKIGFNFTFEDWQKRFLQFVSVDDLRNKIENIEKNLLGVEITLEKEEDTKTKIKRLENEINDYKKARQKKEDIEFQIKNLNAEKYKLAESIENSSELIETIKRLDAELIKFNGISKTNDPQLDEKISYLKKLRLNRIVIALRSIKNKASSFVEVDQGQEKKHVNNLLIFIIFSVLYTLLIVFIYTRTLNLLVLAIGFVSFLILLFLIIVIKITLTKENLPSSLNINLSEPDKSYEDYLGEHDSSEDKFFVNAAWVKALRKERQRINNELKRSFKGKTYEEINKQIQMCGLEIQKRNLESAEIDKNKISSEEYLKKRRELDILKIQKPNSQIQSNESKLSNLPLVIIGLPSQDEKLTAFVNLLEKHFQVIRIM